MGVITHANMWNVNLGISNSKQKEKPTYLPNSLQHDKVMHTYMCLNNYSSFPFKYATWTCVVCAYLASRCTLDLSLPNRLHFATMSKKPNGAFQWASTLRNHFGLKAKRKKLQNLHQMTIHDMFNYKSWTLNFLPKNSYLIGMRT